MRTMENIVLESLEDQQPVEGQSAVISTQTEVRAEQPRKKLDLKKLIVYSELMKPKYDE